MTQLTMELPDHIAEAAAWWAAESERYQPTLRLLRAWVAENGPIPLPDGRLIGFTVAGVEWDHEEIAAHEETRYLITQVDATYSGPARHMERLMTIVDELCADRTQFPDDAPTLATVKRTVDRKLLNGSMRSGGAVREILDKARIQKNRLSIV